MRDRNRRPGAGTLLMLGGLLLIAAALLLAGYNLWDDWRASVSVEKILEQMPAQGTEQAAAAPEEQEISGYWASADGGNDLEQTPVPAQGADQADAAPGEQKIPDYILDPDREMPTVEIDGNTYIGTLDIPSLELSLPVMSE